MTDTADPTESPSQAKPALDLSGAELAVVGDDVLATAQRARKGGGRGSAPRTKEQQVIDELVTQAHNKWVDAGKPKAFAKSPGGRITITDEQYTLAVKAIRKAGAYYDLSIRFGKDLYPREGYVTVVFRASDRPVKEDGGE